MNAKSGSTESTSSKSTEDDIRVRMGHDPMLTAGGVVSSEDDRRPRALSWKEIDDDQGSPNTITGR